MITNREVVSRVRGTHRLLSADGSLNDRAVLAELKSAASVLIKRELNLRKLVATDTIYTTIPCLEMQQVPLSQCCNYVDTRLISRSKYKLPRIGESNYLYAIQGVFAIDQSTKLKEITPTRYINLLNLAARVNETYYWIQNNYLYVTNDMVNKVRISAFFEETVPNEIMFPVDCECSAFSNTDELCINPLDKEFKCPAYLTQTVVDMTSKTLLNTYFRLPEDRQSDDADGQASNQPDR
jgi:hypothetical protein